MAAPELNQPSNDAVAVLHLLREHHNVLISGPPGTGKSRLLAELRYWFTKVVTPAFDPSGPSAFPNDEDIEGIEEWLPSPDRTERQVWSITFHQGTKYRDFVSGLSPRVSGEGPAFIVTRGPLYEAAQHASTEKGAALIEVDEVNRGPAVTVFGDTITAIEGDKRLLSDGTTGVTTSTFRMIKDDGTFEDYSLPYHLYIVAVMNEADTSVEPLDVAFLRRFIKYRLLSNEAGLREYFSLPDTIQNLKDTPSDAQDVYEAAVQAWAAVNDQIALARGAAFQLGHGIFMAKPKAELPNDIGGALRLVSEAWARIYAHVEEVFFGDTRGIASILKAEDPQSPYTLEEKYFVDTPLVRLHGPDTIGSHNVYPIVRSVAGG
jgi:5-methylcytosine-specific restriction protein B